MQDNPREEIAYIAGLFDGEGSIMINRQDGENYMKATKRKTPGYSVSLSLGMIDQQLIEWLGSKLNVGNIVCEKSYHAKRPMYRWYVKNKTGCIHVLNMLMPFLRLKKQQAQLQIQFIQECLGLENKRMAGVPKELDAKREKYWLEMKRLNGIDISLATTKRVGITGRLKSVRVEAIV